MDELLLFLAVVVFKNRFCHRDVKFSKEVSKHVIYIAKGISFVGGPKTPDECESEIKGKLLAPNILLVLEWNCMLGGCEQGF